MLKEFEILHQGQVVNKIWCDDVSDGYHTVSELYNHRYALFCALIRIYDNYITPLGATKVKCWKSKLHNDGTMFEGCFIAGMRWTNIDLTEMQISYHLPLAWWDICNCVEFQYAPRWDGHTSKDVLERLLKL